jgi:hypothetical protein
MRKMTFRLDAKTLELVNGLARRWKVSKSEAVRLALNQAPMTAEPAIATVDSLRRSSSDVEIKTSEPEGRRKLFEGKPEDAPLTAVASLSKGS